ncbi:AttH component of AttEFGH ABC transport system [Rubellimicrobium mesophilum DSM 19309]|uniref:AttH component of AttEFGH ABC transport system n=1 Tax=Rubellimicrobium mesophilum DSM 19309 TaxID=442562 RepID=A0A017HLI6_9RHOB|nr:AttH component of AttEFGH ABC transport system [Rubellimicrobium mesophilum DSM 19309]
MRFSAPSAARRARWPGALKRTLRRALLALWPLAAQGQGFAGLGQSAEGYALPDPAYEFSFPRDHGPHPDFRIEWWYVTANLSAEDGTPYGLQWTLFRSALAPGEADTDQLWMAHAAVTTPDHHYVAERLARGGTGQAGVALDPFDAWIDEWRLTGDDLETATLTAQGTDIGYDMDLTAKGPVVLQGDHGYSVKSEDGQASHYYSQPFFAIQGTLHLPQGDVPVTGTAWLDREWSSQPLTDRQVGWDWFALVLDGGERVMGYRLRATEGEPYAVATWIAADGTPTPYPNGAFTAEPEDTTEVEGREVPTRWHVTLPDHGLDVTVEALNPQSWMATSVPYWEGPITITGSHKGVGYLEMTGY